jgi:mono/diheme cytochrome c family protein
MESRRLMIYLMALLVILLGMLVYLFVQVHQLKPGGEKGVTETGTEADLAEGGAIFLMGKDLKGRMIPISGGPRWFLTEGGGCAVCHGDNGEGGKAVRDLKTVPPSVKEAIKKGIGGMSEEEFGNLVRWGELPNGKPRSYEMPRFDLSDEEVRSLLAFIKRL